MADGTSDAAEEATLEGAAAAWLAERAGELGLDTDDFLERIVAAYRQAESGAEPGGAATEDAAGGEFEERLADLEDRVGAAEDDFDEKLRDVRERVIQVKREADAKADADHDHEGLAGRVEGAMGAVEAVEAETASLRDAVDRLADRQAAGFENFEEVLSYLQAETDALDGKATTLATAVLSMRETLRTLAARESARARAEALQREANVAGVREADCAECGQSVTIAQLSAPECPFCAAAFEDVTAKSGWFGSHTLETGTKPALPKARSWLDEDGGDEDAWLGDQTETLEDIAAGEPLEDVPAGEPGTGEDPGFAWQDEQSDGGDDSPDVDDATPAEVVDADDPLGDEGAADGGRK